MKNNPKVSIITVVYNAMNIVEETIKNVLGQNYGNLEYIIIDGGSTDGTVDILNKYKDRIAYFVSERDGGIYDAMNKGVRAATGEWIGIMNAGDGFTSPDVLKRVFAGDDFYEGVDVVYGDAVAIDGDKRLMYRASDDMKGMMKGPVYRQGASFVRRSTHLKFLFDLSLAKRLGFALDYEQMFRMYRAGCVFKKVPVTVMDYELRGVSTVSPFKPGYYNYLITHDMHCSTAMRVWLVWLACWQKLMSICGKGD